MDDYPAVTKSALLSMACGDAFGAPFEYHERAFDLARLSIREQRYLDSYQDAGSDIQRSRVPGLYTDDTQQAMAMLWVWRKLHLKGKDPTDPDLFAVVLREVLTRMALSPAGGFGVHRGTGKNFRAAIQQGAAVNTAGMGAAMRIGPVATLWPSDRPLELAPWVQRVSEVTTTNQLAKDAAALFALYVYKAANRWQGPPVYKLTEKMLYGDLLNQALDILDWREEQSLLDFAQDTGLSNKELACAANGFVLTGVPWVIYQARLHANVHLSAALSAVCGSGGDTDTVCAMTACLHAVNQGVPGDLSTKHVPQWMVEGLQGKAHLVCPEAWHPVNSERPLTEMEREHRRQLLRARTSGTNLRVGN